MKPREGRAAQQVRKRLGAGLPRQRSLPVRPCVPLGGLEHPGLEMGGEVRHLKPRSLPLWARGDLPLTACCALKVWLPAVWCFSEKLPSQGDAVGRSGALGSERPGLNPGCFTHHLCGHELVIKCPAPGGCENKKCLAPSNAPRILLQASHLPPSAMGISPYPCPSAHLLPLPSLQFHPASWGPS